VPSFSQVNLFASSYTQNGYANFGFKALFNDRSRKYSDRHLYNPTATAKPKVIPNFEIIQMFSVQKAGNDISECEDIWNYVKSDRLCSIALSDGATESSFSQEWAKELVTAFVNHDCPKSSWLIKSQQNWQQWLENQNLSWFAKRKVGQGAFATFLGLEVFDNLRWKAIAVGDSCLFVVRNYELRITNYELSANHQLPITNHQFLKSFPLKHSEEFGNRPRLIGTHSNTEQICFSEIKGVAKIGDRFYLATDAIACWIFKQLEDNQDPWVKLDEISSQDMFVNWVNELRDRHEIANDDTTLLCLEIKR
jgi:hypothetical protein